jgi:hypothetical protein
MNKTIDLLIWLRQKGLITKQQFKTFKGQVLHRDEAGCLRGLKRLKLI